MVITEFTMHLFGVTASAAQLINAFVVMAIGTVPYFYFKVMAPSEKYEGKVYFLMVVAVLVAVFLMPTTQPKMNVLNPNMQEICNFVPKQGEQILTQDAIEHYCRPIYTWQDKLKNWEKTGRLD